MTLRASTLLFRAALLMIASASTWAYFASYRSFPSGWHTDSESILINAVCLSRFGRDEFGTPFPVTFQSFGDYKPGLYFYLLAFLHRIYPISLVAARVFGMLAGYLGVLAYSIHAFNALLPKSKDS